MTIEEKEILDKEIKDAMESKDEARLRRVMARYIMAIGDCQYKTSNRVKSVKTTVENVETDVVSIRQEIKPLKKSHEEYQAERQKREGAKIAIRVIYTILSVGASILAFFAGRFI